VKSWRGWRDVREENMLAVLRCVRQLQRLRVEG
jgi:hypothetical protein